MPLSAKKMCGAAGVNSSSQVSGASARSLQPKCALKTKSDFTSTPHLPSKERGGWGRGEGREGEGQEGDVHVTSIPHLPAKEQGGQEGKGRGEGRRGGQLLACHYRHCANTTKLFLL